MPSLVSLMCFCWQLLNDAESSLLVYNLDDTAEWEQGWELEEGHEPGEAQRDRQKQQKAGGKQPEALPLTHLGTNRGKRREVGGASANADSLMHVGQGGDGSDSRGVAGSGHGKKEDGKLGRGARDVEQRENAGNGRKGEERGPARWESGEGSRRCTGHLDSRRFRSLWPPVFFDSLVTAVTAAAATGSRRREKRRGRRGENSIGNRERLGSRGVPEQVKRRTAAATTFACQDGDHLEVNGTDHDHGNSEGTDGDGGGNARDDDNDNNNNDDDDDDDNDNDKDAVATSTRDRNGNDGDGDGDDYDSVVRCETLRMVFLATTKFIFVDVMANAKRNPFVNLWTAAPSSSSTSPSSFSFSGTAAALASTANVVENNAWDAYRLYFSNCQIYQVVSGGERDMLYHCSSFLEVAPKARLTIHLLQD